MFEKTLLLLSSFATLATGHSINMGFQVENAFLIYGYVVMIYYINGNYVEIARFIKGIFKEHTNQYKQDETI
jgi:hypothetical protein